jgi:hypothetical protein
MNIFEKNKTSLKPIKIFLKSSNSCNIINNLEEKDKNKESSPPSSEININQILHETKLRELEILQQELKELDIKNNSIEKQILSECDSNIKLEEKINKINEKYDKENQELNHLKELNTSKNIEYQRINRIRQQQLNAIDESNQNNNNDNTNNNNALNNLEEIVTGINFLINVSRFRRNVEEDFDNSVMNDNNNNEEGPPMTQEQLDALPCSIYPRNNFNNEKCIICDFDFCFNDTIIKLRCEHKFHKNCLINRLTARHSSKCPNCEESII